MAGLKTTSTGSRITLCKVRGITLNYNASRLVNFDVIKDIIMKQGPVVTVHTEHKIKRKRKSGQGSVSIITEPEDKIESRSSSVGVRVTRRPSRSVINEGWTCPLNLDRCDVSRRAHLPMIDELKFKAQFTCIISGPSGSGKSTFCIRFLQNIDSVCTESYFPGGITWCYSERAAVPSLAGLNVRFHDGLPEKIGDAQGRPCLVNLDDLLNIVY